MIVRTIPFCAHIGDQDSVDSFLSAVNTELSDSRPVPGTYRIHIGILILLHLMQRRIVVPIDAISNSMNSFAKDSRIRPEPLNITSGDEIGQIAASYEKMTEDISDYVNNIEALTREKLENNVQLEIARRIQNGLVPEKTQYDAVCFAISLVTRPARTVGGDFYDGFLRDDGKLCIVMGDVSGKGISAAMFMAMIKTAIRERLTVDPSPAEALNRINDEMCAQNPENLFATVFAAFLDPENGEFVYANAGHTYPVLLKDEPELFIPESGIALGLFEDAGLRDHTMTFRPGQGILLYTGVTLHTIAPELSSFETVKKDVFAVAGDNEKTRRALLACDEALTNIIDHSGATQLKYSCDMQNGRLRVFFLDNGCPFDPTKAEIEEKEFDLLENGGMGLGIIRQSAESADYERMNGLNMLTLHFTV